MSIDGPNKQSHQKKHVPDAEKKPQHVQIDPTEIGVLRRKRPVALALAICFGWLGLDRFYLGRAGIGILKLLTAGLFGILWIVDIIMILTKSVKGVVWEKRDASRSWLSQYMAVPIIVAISLLLSFFLFTRDSSDTSSSNSGKNSTTKTQSAESKQYRFVDRADKQAKDVELLPSESGTVGGIKLTVTGVQYATQLGDYDRADSGKTYIVVAVNLVNTSNETESYDEYDFRVQTAGGQVLDSSYTLSVTDTLSSGDLVAGGTVNGKLVFEVPQEDGHQYLIWKPSYVDSDRAIVQLK